MCDKHLHEMGKIIIGEYVMQAEEKLMVYDGDVNLEVYGPSCIKANNYMLDIRNELRSKRQVLSEFLTVKEFSKKLNHI